MPEMLTVKDQGISYTFSRGWFTRRIFHN